MKYLNIIFTIILSVLVGLSGSLPAFSQEAISMPKVGQMVSLSPTLAPAVLRGIKVDPNNQLQLHFYVDQGDGQSKNHQLINKEHWRKEASVLIKYFFASLTIPETDLWVNLSPYEKNRIIPNEFGQTQMGRDLLAQDYLLKQITASLMYPEGETGKKFWSEIYKQANKKYGRINIPVNTFNKVWIVPEKAVVYENKGTAFVLENHLKVMLEEDYLAYRQAGVAVNKNNNVTTSRSDSKGIATVKNIVREIILPALEKEVNEGANFAPLRQVFYSLILATWYKKKIKDSILAKVYANKNKVVNLSSKGSDLNPDAKVKAIYQQYLQSFKKGVYNYIKDEPDPITGHAIPRKYFAGGVIGVNLDKAMVYETNVQKAKNALGDIAMIEVSGKFDFIMTDLAMKSNGDINPEEPVNEENALRYWDEIKNQVNEIQVRVDRQQYLSTDYVRLAYWHWLIKRRIDLSLSLSLRMKDPAGVLQNKILELIKSLNRFLHVNIIYTKDDFIDFFKRDALVKNILIITNKSGDRKFLALNGSTVRIEGDRVVGKLINPTSLSQEQDVSIKLDLRITFKVLPVDAAMNYSGQDILNNVPKKISYEGNEYDYLESGSQGTVYLNEKLGRVIKIFDKLDGVERKHLERLVELSEQLRKKNPKNIVQMYRVVDIVLGSTQHQKPGILMDFIKGNNLDRQGGLDKKSHANDILDWIDHETGGLANRRFTLSYKESLGDYIQIPHYDNFIIPEGSEEIFDIDPINMELLIKKMSDRDRLENKNLDSELFVELTKLLDFTSISDDEKSWEYKFYNIYLADRLLNALSVLNALLIILKKDSKQAKELLQSIQLCLKVIFNDEDRDKWLIWAKQQPFWHYQPTSTQYGVRYIEQWSDNQKRQARQLLQPFKSAFEEKLPILEDAVRKTPRKENDKIDQRTGVRIEFPPEMLIQLNPEVSVSSFRSDDAINVVESRAMPSMRYFREVSGQNATFVFDVRRRLVKIVWLGNSPIKEAEFDYDDWDQIRRLVLIKNVDGAVLPETKVSMDSGRVMHFTYDNGVPKIWIEINGKKWFFSGYHLAEKTANSMVEYYVTIQSFNNEIPALESDSHNSMYFFIGYLKDRVPNLELVNFDLHPDVYGPDAGPRAGNFHVPPVYFNNWVLRSKNDGLIQDVTWIYPSWYPKEEVAKEIVKLPRIEKFINKITSNLGEIDSQGPKVLTFDFDYFVSNNFPMGHGAEREEIDREAQKIRDFMQRYAQSIKGINFNSSAYAEYSKVNHSPKYAAPYILNALISAATEVFGEPRFAKEQGDFFHPYRGQDFHLKWDAKITSDQPRTDAKLVVDSDGAMSAKVKNKEELEGEIRALFNNFKRLFFTKTQRYSHESFSVLKHKTPLILIEMMLHDINELDDEIVNSYLGILTTRFQELIKDDLAKSIWVPLNQRSEKSYRENLEEMANKAASQIGFYEKFIDYVHDNPSVADELEELYLFWLSTEVAMRERYQRLAVLNEKTLNFKVDEERKFVFAEIHQYILDALEGIRVSIGSVIDKKDNYLSHVMKNVIQGILSKSALLKHRNYEAKESDLDDIRHDLDFLSRILNAITTINKGLPDVKNISNNQLDTWSREQEVDVVKEIARDLIKHNSTEELKGIVGIAERVQGVFDRKVKVISEILAILPVKTTDNSMLTVNNNKLRDRLSEHEGGINLNPSLMTMRVKGQQDINIVQINGQSFDERQVVGVNFWIESIELVNNSLLLN